MFLVRHNEDGLKLVKYLIEKKVDLTKVNSTGRTALDYTILLETCTILDYLLEEISKQDIQNISYDIALITSASLCMLNF